jgi:hypothetical protein
MDASPEHELPIRRGNAINAVNVFIFPNGTRVAWGRTGWTLTTLLRASPRDRRGPVRAYLMRGRPARVESTTGTGFVASGDRFRGIGR